MQLQMCVYAPTANSVERAGGNRTYSIAGGRTLKVESRIWRNGTNISFGPIVGGATTSDAAVFGNGARIEREMGTKRVYTYGKDGTKTYQVDIIWSLKLFNRDGSKAANIPVNETLSSPRDSVGFNEAIGTNNSRTNSEGLATDYWGFGFSRPDGHVTDTQTISTPLGTAQWDQTIHANGDFDGGNTAFFH